MPFRRYCCQLIFSLLRRRLFFHRMIRRDATRARREAAMMARACYAIRGVISAVPYAELRAPFMLILYARALSMRVD